MQVVVPFAADEPKTRLEAVLTPTERSAVARAMLADVLAALVETGHEPTVLSTVPLELEAVDTDTDADTNTDIDIETDTDTESLAPALHSAVSVTVDDRPLTEAVNAVLETADEAVAIVMADLALATPDSLTELFETTADVVIAPGRGGGTNALVVRHSEFRVNYHGASYLDHCEHARAIDATLESVDSFRLSTDVDEPDDLVEVLVHDSGRTATRLRALGFELDRTAGRVDVSRTDTKRNRRD